MNRSSRRRSRFSVLENKLGNQAENKLKLVLRVLCSPHFSVFSMFPSPREEKVPAGRMRSKTAVFIDGANMYFAYKFDIIITPSHGWHLGLANCNIAGVAGQTLSNQPLRDKANRFVDAVIGVYVQLCQKSSSVRRFLLPAGAFRVWSSFSSRFSVLEYQFESKLKLVLRSFRRSRFRVLGDQL